MPRKNDFYSFKALLMITLLLSTASASQAAGELEIKPTNKLAQLGQSSAINSQSNYWLQTLLLDVENADQRDAILKATNDAGFMTRPAWILMHELLPFNANPYMDLTTARSLRQRLINIPSSTI